MGASLRTPYSILGISENANNNQIRSTFREHIHAMKRGELSKHTFASICRAFECLSDHEKRQSYDETKHWISKLPVNEYTLQQLAAEPHFIEIFKSRLNKSTLRSINSQDFRTGHTALYCAARTGNLLGVIYLLVKGANIDLCQRTKSTALHVSSFYGHPEIVRCLLENGADYRIRNNFQHTAEEEAYNDDICQVFVELKQNPFVQTAANQFDWLKTNIEHVTEHIDHQYFLLRQTLLHCACRKGYFEIVQWLVEQRRCNLDIVDINLNSAFHHACRNGHSIIVEYLLNHGANSLLINKSKLTAEQEGKQYGNSINEIFENIRTRNVFDMAANGVLWWFQYHFDNHSPNEINSDGASLLYIACRYGQTSVAKWLLDHGANINIQLKSGTGSTPLHSAVYFGHISTVELLLAYGADVNIKNNYGATVFDEDAEIAIRLILEQYRRNLKNDKLMPVHIYVDPANTIAKVYLRFDAKQKDLIEVLPVGLHQKNGYFSIAQRQLHFESDETTILTAVCQTRYVKSKFIEIPLHLTYSYGKSTRNQKNKLTTDFNSEYSTFLETFDKHCHQHILNIPSSLDCEQTHYVENLCFIIPIGSNDQEISLQIQYLTHPDLHEYNLPGCICIFKITYESRAKLKELPIVSFSNLSNIHLYTLASPSPYWFTYDTHQKRLPTVEGIYAFVRHIEVIPNLLCLPADMFIAMSLNKPLLRRNHPVPCKYLKICPQDTHEYPLIAYHGTRIDVIRSILTDGLVLPGTIVANGTRIQPPANHIPLYVKTDSFPNFAGAIFVSPSINYSCDSTYSTSFEYQGKRLLPVLECSVKSNSYTMHHSTLSQYHPHSTDNIQTIEWRVTDPINVQVNAVLFVIKEFD